LFEEIYMAETRSRASAVDRLHLLVGADCRSAGASPRLAPERHTALGVPSNQEIP
jgi:hypothetical protein